MAEQCSTSAPWRGVPLATRPTPNLDYRPEKGEYYTQVVVKAAWPAAIGVGLGLVLILVLTLWRLVRCCCRREGVVSAKRPTVRRLRCAQAAALVMALGVLGGCAFGLASVGPHVVDHGLEVLGEVKAFVSGVSGAANATLDLARDLDGAVLGIEGVLLQGINVTTIGGELEALRPWLAGLPDPSALSASIAAARSQIDSVLSPALESLVGTLASLAGKIGNTSAPGPYTTALRTIIDSQPVLNTLVVDSNAFIAAAAALPASENVPAMTAARARLAALMTTPTSFASKLATLAALQAAVSALNSAVTTDQFVQSAAADLATVNATATALLDTAVPPITADLQAIGSGAAGVAANISALLDTARAINDTLLTLPPALADKISWLQAAQAALGALDSGVTAGDGSLSAALGAVSAELAAPPALGAALGTLSAMQAQLDALPDLAALAASIASVRTAMAASQSGLATLLSSMTGYLGLAPNPGFYGALRAPAQSAGAAMGPIAAALGAMQASPLASQAAGIAAAVDGLAASGELTALGSLLGGMQAAVAGLPAPPSYEPQLQGMAAQYAALPQPPTRLLDDALAAVEDTLDGVLEALRSAHATIQGRVPGVQEKVDSALQHDILGAIRRNEDRLLPTVRTADKWRQVAMYLSFGLGILLALLLLGAAALTWPAPLKLATSLLLVLATLYFILVLALSAGLKVGNDGCVNLEGQVIARLDGTLGSGSGQALAAARYYLRDEGGPPAALLRDAFGVDLGDLQAQIDSARGDLLDAVDQYQLKPALAAQVDAAVNVSYEVQAGLDGVLDRLSYSAVHPVYLSATRFACCEGLDTLGALWLAWLLAGAFGLALCAAAAACIATLDGVPSDGACSRMRVADFWGAAGPGGGGGPPPAPLPAKRPAYGAGLPPPKQQFMVAAGTGRLPGTPGAAAKAAAGGSQVTISVNKEKTISAV